MYNSFFIFFEFPYIAPPDDKYTISFTFDLIIKLRKSIVETKFDSISYFILIFLGIFLFQYFGNFFNTTIELILNILLFLFLIHFIYGKISIQNKKISFSEDIKYISVISIITKTLAFTYLNPHVYSDTVFFLGNFSKNFLVIDKYYFGIGASISSLLFFFVIGYLSKLLSKYLQSDLIWKRINLFIITFMSIIALYVLIEIIKFF